MKTCLFHILLTLTASLLAACISGPPAMPRNIAPNVPDSMADPLTSPLVTQMQAADGPSDATPVVYKRAVNFAVNMPLEQVFQIEVRRANGDYERYRFPKNAVPRIDTDDYLAFREQWIHLAAGDEVIYEGSALK